MTESMNYPDYKPAGVNLRVPNMEYAADINIGSPYQCRFGAPLALSANGIIASAQMVNGSGLTITDLTTTAGATGTATAIGYYGYIPFDSTTVFTKGWGRGISVVASGANTRTLTVTGYDYLGQVMCEVITINGNTTVNGNKAFFRVISLVWSSSTDTTTVNVGWSNKLGLPYAGNAMVTEVKDQALAANAGTFTGALVDATASANNNADVRGTYLPATVIPDGSHTFEITYMPRRGNLHGNAQAAS